MLHIHTDPTTQHTSIVSFEDVKRGHDGIQSRWNWTTKEQVDEIAALLSKCEGELYIGIDCGANTSPRFDIIKAPKVGDVVSKYFNGDAYPVGTIVSISKTMKRIVTSSGQVFHRKKETGRWSDGCFALVQGHREEQNPSF